MRTPLVKVTINLDAIRASAEAIRRQTGVKLIAVIKADAYGLGAGRVADALAPVVDEFAYFAVHEARAIGRGGLVTGPPVDDPAEYRALGLRPAIGRPEDAARFAGLPVAINVDTGMQRFGCPPDQLDDLVADCEVVDYFAHSETLEAVRLLRATCGGRGRPIHAAATSLLPHAEAWLDAVRPGLALYRGAVRVTTPLHTVRATRGPIGYTRFECSRIGTILAGYSNGLHAGPVVLNGRRQQVLEVGMNTAFVTVAAEDRVGDDVVLLGDGLAEAELAAHLHVRPHEILCRYSSIGTREYVHGGAVS